jgi:PEP-CTERM motif
MCLLLATSATIQANSLTLTPAGKADGFTLSTFATINPANANTFAFGTFGIAVTSSGDIVTSNFPNDTRYVFKDTNGQTVGSALFAITPSGSTTSAYATAGGRAYGGANGQFVQFNNDGTINRVLTGVAASPYLGMWGDPVNGHIIATSTAGLIDINPSANGGVGSFRVIDPGVFGDGVSISPDGKIAYVEQGSINGYNIATGALVYNSGPLFSSPDGTGVISSSNKLNGKIIVNTNLGEIDLLDPSTNTFVAIATGGNRGDYVSPDTNNGTLFLDYSDTIERLSCGPNCSIGGPSTPEPSTLSLFALSLFAIVALTLRTRRHKDLR